jgi:hypothetical protein
MKRHYLGKKCNINSFTSLVIGFAPCTPDGLPIRLS